MRQYQMPGMEFPEAFRTAAGQGYLPQAMATPGGTEMLMPPEAPKPVPYTAGQGLRNPITGEPIVEATEKAEKEPSEKNLRWQTEEVDGEYRHVGRHPITGDVVKIGGKAQPRGTKGKTPEEEELKARQEQLLKRGEKLRDTLEDPVKLSNYAINHLKKKPKEKIKPEELEKTITDITAELKQIESDSLDVLKQRGAVVYGEGEEMPDEYYQFLLEGDESGSFEDTPENRRIYNEWKMSGAGQ
jgi:hypothetical protein